MQGNRWRWIGLVRLDGATKKNPWKKTKEDIHGCDDMTVVGVRTMQKKELDDFPEGSS